VVWEFSLVLKAFMAGFQPLACDRQSFSTLSPATPYNFLTSTFSLPFKESMGTGALALLRLICPRHFLIGYKQIINRFLGFIKPLLMDSMDILVHIEFIE
jgi:hypothetical protein